MATHDIVVIGASAGGIEALSNIVKNLPPTLAASIFVVVHISPDSPGYLPEILANRGPLPASNAKDGEKFARGHIYVAPPDHHLLVEANGTMRTSRGPRENRSRPAVDPLFRSAALAFGPRVVGVVLSGGLDDGTAGLRAIKMCGGVSIVQDPSDSLADSMPLTALRNVTIDYCKPSDELGQLLASIIVSPV